MSRIEAREELLKTFDHNGPARPGALFGLPFTSENAEIIIIPIPWEATVSYGSGTAEGPQAVLNASSQVDLEDTDMAAPWSQGIAMLPIREEIKVESTKYRNLAQSYIHWLESEELITDNMKVIPRAVDEIIEKLHIHTRATAHSYIEKGQIVGVLGGDHSTPLGLLQALSIQYPTFGILQIDAHADLRERYEDFQYSHASIMFNALKIPNITSLTQVGIRDFCEEEFDRIEHSNGRIQTFFDNDLSKAMFEGTTWDQLCHQIVSTLPHHVYISFDIDGLQPAFCPNTGTPVPGGLTTSQVRHLLRVLVQSGKKIIGFDLNEVAPGKDEWDANVGARMLYLLACFAGLSHNTLQFRR